MRTPITASLLKYLILITFCEKKRKQIWMQYLAEILRIYSESFVVIVVLHRKLAENVSSF